MYTVYDVNKKKHKQNQHRYTILHMVQQLNIYMNTLIIFTLHIHKNIYNSKIS